MSLQMGAMSLLYGQPGRTPLADAGQTLALCCAVRPSTGPTCDRSHFTMLGENIFLSGETSPAAAIYLPNFRICSATHAALLMLPKEISPSSAAPVLASQFLAAIPRFRTY